MTDYKTLKDRILEVKKIPIENILAKFGHQPQYAKKQGLTLWYKSPLSMNDKTPSFVLDTQKNRFDDYSKGVQGDIFDFLEAYKSFNLMESLRYLEGEGFEKSNYVQAISTNQKEYKIKKVQPLQNKALIAYLESRYINIDIAKDYLQEIYYYINNKHFFSLTMINRSKGYEIRNKFFKGCLKKKDITVLASGKKGVSVFEGFMDFLSLLTYKEIKELKTDVIILNSTEMLGKSKDVLKNYGKAYAFLDNDEAGEMATKKLSEMLPTKDMRYLYQSHDDFNEWLKEDRTLYKIRC